MRSVFILVTMTMLAAACGGGGGSSRAPQAPAAPAPAGIIDGAIAKGVIVGGEVEVREVLTDGTLSDVIGTGTTDASGGYNAEVSADYQGGPLKVSVTAVAGTTMKCDAPSGCGTAAFGDDVPLAAGFSLSAFVTELGGAALSVHVTPITDLAARRAEADPDGLDVAAVAEANDVVRQTFSLPGDITAIEPVDLTDPDAVAIADSASQQVAVLSAGILEAVQQTDDVVNGGVSFEDATTAFAEDFVEDGGLVLNDTAASEASIVSLDDILSGATGVVAQVEADADAAGVDAGLDDVAASIEVTEMSLPETPSDDADTSIEPVDTVLAGRLERGKALISDVRDVTASARLDEVEAAAEVFGDSIELAFEDQVDLVTGVVTNDFGLVAEALVYGVDAMSRAGDASLDDPTLTTFTVPAAVIAEDSPEITVTIAGETLSVDQSINGVAVALNGTFSATTVEQIDDVVESFQAEGMITLSGTAANDEFSLAINSGSQASLQLTDVETVTSAGFTTTFTVPSFSLDLDVTATALQAVNTPAFDGAIGLDVVGLAYTEDDRMLQNPDGTVGNLSVETLTFTSFDVSLSGAFSDAAGNSVEATFSLDADNDNGFILQLEELFSFDPVLGTATATETENEETAENFVAASAAIGLIASLPGIDDVVQVTLSVERTGVEDGSGELSVQFDGKSLTVTGNSVDEIINISNQDGVLVILAEDSTTGLLSGAITVDGEEVASIEENEDGVVIVRYSDGTFETFA